MKLVFYKENEELKVQLNHDGKDLNFDYVKLIEYLYSNQILENTEYPDDMSENEKTKINAMITEFNNAVVKHSIEENPS